MKNDVLSEIGFYTKERTTTGHLYVRPKTMPVKYPDVLFFCLYTARILNTKKVALNTANKIKDDLKLGSAWEKVLNGDDDAEVKMPITVVEYKQNPRYSFSASMLIRKRIHFRFGYLGFGFLTRKKLLSKCAEYAVFTMMYTIRKLNMQNKTALQYLWQAAELLGNKEFGIDFNRKNCEKAAENIYTQVTGDKLTAFK